MNKFLRKIILNNKENRMLYIFISNFLYIKIVDNKN